MCAVHLLRLEEQLGQGKVVKFANFGEGPVVSEVHVRSVVAPCSHLAQVGGAFHAS